MSKNDALVAPSKAATQSIFGRLHRGRQCFVLLASSCLFCLAIVPSAFAAAKPAASVSLLYPFSIGQYPPTGAPPATNLDGIGPAASLVLGTNGLFYGATSSGGLYGAGGIFSTSAGGNLDNFYSFPEIIDGNGISQYNFAPNGLVLGTNGNFYGTTQSGGSNFNGSIFMVTPAGTFKNLYAFSAVDNNLENADGANPIDALTLGNDGNFYGVTQFGGSNGTGTIFQLTPAGGFTSLYSFSALGPDSANSDGASPNALVLAAGTGTFYGTTQNGGAKGAGTVFQFTPAGGLTTLYSFQSAGANDPDLPNAALVQGPNGNFYGTSTFGGSQSSGTIFQVTPDGTVKVLYSLPQSDDGATSTLTLGSDGNFYGTTAGDGANGTGTIYEMTLAGAYTALYSFPAVDTNLDNTVGANPEAGLTLGSDGNLYGSCLQGGANGSGTIFEFTTSSFVSPTIPPSFAKEPPATLSAQDGTSATISVTAKGSATLVYQWLRNGTNLSDGGDIANSSTSTLTINPLQPADAGTYSVLISNSYGKTNSASTKLTVTPDLVSPTVTITSPKANARVSSPLLTGTASDNIRVTNVVFTLTNLFTGSNFTGWATLTKGTGAVSNWSINVPPLPGTNILKVQSVDFSSRTSKAVSVTFFCQAPSPLTVNISGGGGAKITGTASAAGGSLPANGAMLNLGESYTIAAAPNSSSLFSNWVNGAAVSNNPTLKFIMGSNTVLTANVVSNFFLGAAGTYNGLFYPTNTAVAEENSGMLENLLLMTSGTYSATLLTGGKSYKISSNFDVSGHSAFHAGSWHVNLTLDSATPQITGTVSNAQWNVPLLADFASKSFPSAAYTLLFAPSSGDSANAPPGDGYATVTNHLGLVTLLGALADGTAYSQKVTVSQTGDLPVYESLYGNTGLLLGWINLTNLNVAPPVNQLAWIKKPARTGIYPGGFTNLLDLQGSPWLAPPAKTAAVNLTNGQLVISNASIDLTFSGVLVSNNNAVLNVGGNAADKLSGTLNAKTGQLLLTFGDNGKAPTSKAYGVVLQDQTNGGGYFITTTNAGAVILQP